MTEARQALPRRLTAMAPGPELGARLLTVDRKRLRAADLHQLIRARQIAHEQAELMADLAQSQLLLGAALTMRPPMVLDAPRAGRIDLHRTHAFVCPARP